MQKKVIALAVAALASSAAFAQTNVTVYGVVDMGQAWVKGSGAANGGQTQSTVGRLDSNSSYIGFKGVEDLGNGLKAVFQMETGYNADNGTGHSAGRDSFIGLTGGFGTFVMGNLTHPLRAMGAKVELMPGAAGFGTMASLTGTLAGAQTGADNRAANALAYVSPSFSGFSGTVAYVNGENKTKDGQAGVTPPAITASLVNKIIAGTVTPADFGYSEGKVNNRAWQVAGQYENGPIFGAVGYHKAYDFGNVTDQDARIWRVAGSYTLPTNTKLTALYDNTKIDVNGEYVKRTAWSIGAAQSFGKNTVGLEYARSGKIKTNEEGADTANTGANILSALYTYEISKRTSVHARYSRLANDDASKANFYLNPVANPITAANGVNLTGYMVGLRHSF
jgi:predicted porin